MMKNHRVLLVLVLSLAFVLFGTASTLMATNTNTKANCDPAQCKTAVKCDPSQCKTDVKCDPANCKPSDKCDPSKCKPSDKCDPSQCTTATKTSSKSSSDCCPHSKGKVKEDPGT